MIDIAVDKSSEDDRTIALRVRVTERRDEGGRGRESRTEHEVTLGRDVLERLAPGEAAEEFVRRCFAFLLERESKESILRRFDVTVIGRYFPEFEGAIARR